MDISTFDYSDARRMMVDGQVRPNKVTDPRIIGAMRTLPREAFVPARLAARAYADEDVPLDGGRVLMEPMVLARLVQLARPVGGEKALVVGAGTGYGAAVLSMCGLRVTALEEDPALIATCRRALAGLAATLPEPVRIVEGPLAQGWAEGGPWDIILLEGAVTAIPPALAGQLRRDGGRLVTVLRPRGETGRAVLAEHTGAPDGAIRAQPEFDCSTPLLPSLVPAAGFHF